MTRVVTALAISADGYIAGPNDGPGKPARRRGRAAVRVVVPVLLGGGLRLFGETAAELELTSVTDAPGVTHLTYEVNR